MSQAQRNQAQSTPPTPPADAPASLSPHIANKHILVAITGGIACYKVANLVSSLVQHGSQVRVLMTQAAKGFVGPLTFASLTGHKVIGEVTPEQVTNNTNNTNNDDDARLCRKTPDCSGGSAATADDRRDACPTSSFPTEPSTSEHVYWARWCELMIIAPLSANTLAKLAAGLCDNPVTLTACALPATTPVLLAPAMNEQMWLNPITQRNLAAVKDLLGHQIVGPGTGWQACRTLGPGRMSEPNDILKAAGDLLGAK